MAVRKRVGAVMALVTAICTFATAPAHADPVAMANMALSDGGKAMLDVDNLHIKADACGGDVTIRSYVYLRISTASAHTEFAIYGDPMKI